MKKNILGLIFLFSILLVGCNNQQNNTALSPTNYEQNYGISNTNTPQTIQQKNNEQQYLTTEQQNIGGQPSLNKPLNQQPKSERVKQENARKARDLLLKQPEVKRVEVVEGKDVVIAAIELKHWNTFRSEKLTQKFKEKLEKELSPKKVEATTDHKIYIELEKLQNQLNKNDLSKKEVDKKLKKLQKLMKEQT